MNQLNRVGVRTRTGILVYVRVVNTVKLKPRENSIHSFILRTVNFETRFCGRRVLCTRTGTYNRTVLYSHFVVNVAHAPPQ